MNKKGFTLIELLVVVAIIGILATVVITSLSQARLRARDAAIKAAISGARAEIEMHYLDNTTGTGYLGFTPTAQNASISANGGTPTYTATLTTGVAYTYSSDLNIGSDHFCVDSTGFAGEVPSAGITAGTSCK